MLCLPRLRLSRSTCWPTLPSVCAIGSDNYVTRAALLLAECIRSKLAQCVPVRLRQALCRGGFGAVCLVESVTGCSRPKDATILKGRAFFAQMLGLDTQAAANGVMAGCSCIEGGVKPILFRQTDGERHFVGQDETIERLEQVDVVVETDTAVTETTRTRHATSLRPRYPPQTCCMILLQGAATPQTCYPSRRWELTNHPPSRTIGDAPLPRCTAGLPAVAKN